MTLAPPEPQADYSRFPPTIPGSIEYRVAWPRLQVRHGRITTRHLLLALLLAALGIVVCAPAWKDIFIGFAAADEEYSHIFLVPFVAVWLAWVRRKRLAFCPHSGTLLGPILVAAGWLLSWVGFNYSGQLLWHGGAVVVFVGCVLSALGKPALFRFLPSVLVLAFLVPLRDVREEIALPLQNATAQIVAGIFNLLQADVELAGNVLVVNGTDVTIAEACNGMRLVMPLLLVTYAFAFALPLRMPVRLLLIGFSPLVALACNVIRTIPVVYLHGHAPRELAENVHTISGWAMLPLAFLVLLGIVRTLRWAALPVHRYTLAGL